MKHIDKLLVKAREIASNLLKSLYEHNDDGFIEALGLDPERYKHMVGDEPMYDSMAALNDSCKTTWSVEDNDL